jgi:myo-inositol catabolism protein IolC
VALGHDGRLYLLAFDHRAAFQDLLDAGEPATQAEARRIGEAKAIALEGLLRALERGAGPRDAAGIFVDEQFGADVARAARRHGVLLAMPVEESGQDVFRFAYGEDFAAHLEAFRPDFAKVLVRHNVGGDVDGNRMQLQRLRRLADWLHGNGGRLLFELIVPPTAAQLAAAGGDVRRFEAEQRPALALAAVREAQDAGVDVDIWKFEGVDERADAEALARQARSGPGREGVACILLGAGATTERVEHWLSQVATVEGFQGFAIGRSIWAAPLRAWHEGTLDRDGAVERIAGAYAHVVGAYEREAATATDGVSLTTPRVADPAQSA